MVKEFIRAGLLSRKGGNMNNRKKTITLTIESQKKKTIFEVERARRMLAYNCAMKGLVRNTSLKI